MNGYGEYCIKDAEGNQWYNNFNYVDYYCEHLLDYYTFKDTDGKEVKIYNCITLKEFTAQFSKVNPDFDEIGFFQKIISEKRLDKLQTALESEGKRVCMFNMCILALYILEKAKCRYLVLLKPTVDDTLAELKDVKKITFTNEDGSKVESNLKGLIASMLNNAKGDEKTKYEVDRVITWDKVSDNKLMQSLFVHDLSVFLNDYFKVKRKKDALVSTKEQELIRYLMYFFGLTPAVVTDSRYRQLMAYYKNIVMPNQDIHCLNIDGKPRYIKFDFINYQTWKSGKIDWTKYRPFEINLGDTIQFQPRNRQFFAVPITNDFLFQFPDYSLYFCAR